MDGVSEVKTIIFRLVLFVLITPAIAGFVDMYCTFFLGSQLTGIKWEGAFTTCFALFTLALIPLFGLEFD
jgi:hypothetical protein